MLCPSDELYLMRCLDLARRSRGLHAPNPEVGAVLVYEGRILGEGYHRRRGQAHAEVNALAAVAPDDRPYIPKATLYVSLEPCNHRGLTPPCADLVLKEGIRRVVIAQTDPFPLVAGKSVERLRAAGVEVLVAEGEVAARAAWLNRRFLTACNQNRPYVILKYAVSADGYMGVRGENRRISNSFSRRLAHRWRGEETAILVGSQTALTDNPRLDNRAFPLLPSQPLRLVIDRQARLPAELHLFDGSLPTWILGERQPGFDPKPGTEFHQLDFQGDWIDQLLALLHSRSIRSLLVEGGAQILQCFIDAGRWDEARIFIGRDCLGEGIPAPQLTQARLLQEQPLGDNRLQIFVRQKPLLV